MSVLAKESELEMRKTRSEFFQDNNTSSENKAKSMVKQYSEDFKKYFAIFQACFSEKERVERLLLKQNAKNIECK